MKAPVEETDYKPWLHNAQNAGVGKKKKGKQLSRQQKVRQQKAVEKAGVNVNKLERKVADSKVRAKKVQARAKDWEELNQTMGTESEATQVPRAAVELQATVRDGGEARAMDDVEVVDPDQHASLAEQKEPNAASDLQPAATTTVNDLDEVT